MTSNGVKYTCFIMIGLASIFSIYVFFIIYQGHTRNDAQNAPILPNQSETNSQQWETKTDDRPPVTVKVTPIELGKDVQTWKFDIVMDTHSVELDQDMIRVVVLVDDFDKEYGPVRWEGAEAGGHHREGVLVFAPIAPYPQRLKLNIKGVGDAQRLFSWILTE